MYSNHMCLTIANDFLGLFRGCYTIVLCHDVRRSQKIFDLYHRLLAV